MFSTVFITLSLIAKPINDGHCDQLSETFQDREAFSFSTQTRIRKEFIQDRLVTRASTSLSSAETSLLLWGGWGERKRKRAGHDGKWKERREAPAPSPSSHRPQRAFYFHSIIAIFIGIPSGNLC